MSATQVLQRQRSVLLATSSLATRGTPTPRATTEMVSPKLGRGLVASDNIIDLSEGVKPSNQKVRGCMGSSYFTGEHLRTYIGRLPFVQPFPYWGRILSKFKFKDLII